MTITTTSMKQDVLESISHKYGKYWLQYFQDRSRLQFTNQVAHILKAKIKIK